MDISVIIAVSKPKQFLKCLDGFANQKTDFAFEIIGVGAVFEMDSTNWPFPLKLIPCDTLHANVRRNIGVKHSVSARIGLMDDDCIPDENWINEACSHSHEKSIVVSGMELPLADSGSFSALSYKVLSTPITELSINHTLAKEQEIKWHEVVFCNCVLSKSAWENSGGFSESIPWDMDDFHFCYGLKERFIFLNSPRLKVQHNRYPTSFNKLIAYKWNLRVRTGEKIVTHPGIYLRVPAVVAAFLFPWLAFMISGFLLLVCPVVLLTILLVYMGLISFTSFRNYPAVLKSAAILLSVQIITIVAIQYGFCRALFGFTNRGY